jgi:hypothetical protein
LVCVVVVAIGAVGVVVWRSRPAYRIAFVVDTSAAEASSAVAGAVGSAVQNTGDGDALSLRRFGGQCGDPGNTAQVVGAGTGHAARISRSVRGLATGGSATLESGVLAAIKDFSGHYPFHGTKSNRIIVITSRGTDACTRDQAAVKKTLQEKVKAAGLHLDFRFVGYLTPSGEQANLTQLASAVNAKTPKFAQTPADLTATLKNLVIPNPTEAEPLNTPTPGPITVDNTGQPVDQELLRIAQEVLADARRHDGAALDRLLGNGNATNLQIAEQNRILARPGAFDEIINILTRTHCAITDGCTWPGFTLSNGAGSLDRSDMRLLHVSDPQDYHGLGIGIEQVEGPARFIGIFSRP